MSDFLKLIRYFLRSAEGGGNKVAVVAIIVAGVVSGMASTALIALINGAINRLGSSMAETLGLAFLGLLIALPLSRFTSSMLLVRVTQRAFHRLRMDLCRRILAAPLRHLESLGPGRLLASLTDDVGTIGGALGTLPSLSMNFTIILCSFVYLGWLSWELLLVVLLFMVLGFATYLFPVRRARGHFAKMRDAWDSLIENVRGLTEGTKELKLHRHRRRAFFTDLIETSSNRVRRHTIIGNTIYAAASSWGSIIFFVLIGTILFVAPRFVEVVPETLTGFTLVILYLTNPLEMIMAFLPGLSRANIAVRRVEKLGGELADNAADPLFQELPLPAAAWKRLELSGVTHSYYREGDEDEFTLGPIDLRIDAGEMLFIVGGNGSGKTTLAKLLMGLYVPERGVIRVDGQPVGDDDRDQYRQRFSAVFQDFFLFDQLLGLEAPELDQRARHYLRELQLTRKLTVEEGKLSTIELSRGQRKRLALLTAYLEDRPIYVFDEWAADQDPQFKRIFYLKLLPDLRRRDKTVVVISHDDHYYELADRIVKLEYGQMEFDGPVADYLEQFGEMSEVLPNQERAS